MHNTGNPLGSTSLLDLYDNSETIDNFVNSQQDEVPDRFGTKRLTLAGLIKRSMTLRNEINDFSGALTFKPEWSDVPMNVSEGVGGEGGALNLQAEALGNRSEINKITSREALRRTYQEVGLNLVEGSFELGGVLVNNNDVLLHRKSGKVFSGSPGEVLPGTNPDDNRFVNRSNALRLGDILLDRYGADPTGVLDSSEALALADAAATTLGKGNVGIILSPGGTYRIASHVTINNPLICHGNRATVKFDYLWSMPMSYIFPIPRQLSNVVLQAVNAGLHTVNLMSGEAYFLEIEKTTIIGFADALSNSGVYVNLRKCRFENNLRAWSPKTLTSQNAPSTMFSASETIFVGNVEDGLAVRPNVSGSNDDLINLELRSCGFEQNRNGLVALQRIWNLTMVDCWFEGNVNKAYHIVASNPTLLNVRVHPSDANKTNIGGWAQGTGQLTGNVNEISEGGVNTRNLWLHDTMQDSYPSAKKTRVRKVGNDTRISEDSGATEKCLVLSRNLTAGTRTLVELYIPSTALTITDVVNAPEGWTMVKSGVGVFQFTLPVTLAVRPVITVTPVQTVNLADEDKTVKVSLGNTDPATWNSFKTVNRFNIYTKSNGVLSDVGFNLKMTV